MISVRFKSNIQWNKVLTFMEKMHDGKYSWVQEQHPMEQGLNLRINRFKCIRSKQFKSNIQWNKVLTYSLKESKKTIITELINNLRNDQEKIEKTISKLELKI